MFRQIAIWIERNRDVLFVLAVFMVFIIIFVPLPTTLIDLLLIVSITFALLTILTAIYVKEPLDFSVFPNVLLVSTALRLALNIATTRLILTNAAAKGPAAAGEVIRTFGFFVTGAGTAQENVVVGFVLFLIIIIINFIVITRGSNRISEVAARFTLDAMPGKQMAIDADLNSGLITEQEARERRSRITREADFYGAMDGATKFVRGDAIAGLIITLINIIGGLIIGPLQYGMSLLDALRTYSILTIGDGLAAQVPALIVSLSAGIIVARASTQAELGREFMGQLFSGWKPLIFVGGFLLFLAITPLPKLQLLVVAGIIFLIATLLRQGETRRKKQEIERQQRELARQPERVEELLKVDPLELEIGYGIIKLADPNQGGTLVERIQRIRRQMALDYGFIVPPIRIRDNMQLESGQYVIKIRGVEVAQGNIIPDAYLAMDPGTATGPVEGVKTTEPVFGMTAYWITEENKQKAETLGYTVVDATTVLATHLTEVVRQHAAELLTREEVNHLLDTLRETHRRLVDEVVDKVISVGHLQRILQGLLQEGVSIRDLPTILEVVGEYAIREKNTEVLIDLVRNALARHITSRHLEADGKIYVITVDPRLEETIKSVTERTEHGSRLNLAPAIFNKITQEFRRETERVLQKGHMPVILCAPHVRSQIKKIADIIQPGISVLSHNEITKATGIEVLGTIALE